MEPNVGLLIIAVIASCMARDIIIKELKKYGYHKRTMYASQVQFHKPHILIFWGIICMMAAPAIIVGRILRWNPKTTDD